MKKDKVVYFHHQCLFLYTCGKGCTDFTVKFLWFYSVLVIFQFLKITCVKYNHNCGLTANVYKNIFIKINEIFVSRDIEICFCYELS